MSNIEDMIGDDNSFGSFDDGEGSQKPNKSIKEESIKEKSVSIEKVSNKSQ